jgi:hypothetical protein
MKPFKTFCNLTLAGVLALSLAACGGSDDSNGGGSRSPTSRGGGGGSSTFTVGGTVSGLPSGTNLVLQDNQGDDLTVSANGVFTFATALADGTTYAATVQTQPAGASCTVTNGSGTVASANITNIAVACHTTVASTTAVSVLSVGGARIAFSPLATSGSGNAYGITPLSIDGLTKLSGTSIPTSFQVEACSVDSTNLVAACISYSNPTVVMLDLSAFAVTLNIDDIKVHELSTGATSYASFSGGSCRMCGVVTIPSMKSFIVSAADGYRVYAYPASTDTSLTLKTTYKIPVTENFAVSLARNWLISPDYYSSSTRKLRIIDLASGQEYDWDTSTGTCSSTDGTGCNRFVNSTADSVTIADDTGLLIVNNEAGTATLTLDMSQSTFTPPATSGAAGTFTAPHVYSDFYSVVPAQMSGVLASSVGHWAYFVAEWSAHIGIQAMPASGGSGGALTLPPVNPAYLDLSRLAWSPTCKSFTGGGDPHSQGYTVTSVGTPMGIYLSGDYSCVAVIDFAKLAAAPRQSASPNMIDTTNYDPIKDGAVTFYKVGS